MHILLLCATQRGLKFLEKLKTLCPGDELTVVSFKEEPWEPKFLDDIKNFCIDHKLRFFQAKNVSSEHARDIWSKPADLMLLVHWRYLLSKDLIQIPRLGAVVFHDSLLPAYRGFSPTVWAIIKGETKCGATLFHIEEAVDHGDIIDQMEVSIGENDRIKQVMEKVTEAYLLLLVKNIELLKDGKAPRRPQNHEGATYTVKRTPADNVIDWGQPARVIHNLIRAVSHPYPGAFTQYQGEKLFIWSAEPYPFISNTEECVPGRVAEILPSKGAIVFTGRGALLIQDVQIEKHISSRADLVLQKGSQLGAIPSPL
jgi:methionyl-tRNA formyltransferase